MVESTRFKNEEGSCYLLLVPCANPSDRQHEQGGLKKWSNRLDSTQIVHCVVDSTNWKVDLRDT